MVIFWFYNDRTQKYTNKISLYPFMHPTIKPKSPPNIRSYLFMRVKNISYACDLIYSFLKIKREYHIMTTPLYKRTE